MKNQIRSCLWFDDQAEVAAKFYCSVFENSKITAVTPMVVSFEINGSQFIALNGNRKLKFNDSVSFVIHCETQVEIDYYWNKLTEGGEESRCGWLKDRFGISWQVVPASIAKYMSDPAKIERVTNAILPMKKLDIEAIERAYSEA